MWFRIDWWQIWVKNITFCGNYDHNGNSIVKKWWSYHPMKIVKFTLFFSFLLLYTRLANELANTTSDNAIKRKTKKIISVKHWPFTRNGEINQLHHTSVSRRTITRQTYTWYIRRNARIFVSKWRFFHLPTAGFEPGTCECEVTGEAIWSMMHIPKVEN